MRSGIAIGVGCRRGCSADVIEALVRQALGQAAAAHRVSVHLGRAHPVQAHPVQAHPVQAQPVQAHLAQINPVRAHCLPRADCVHAVQRLGLFTIVDKTGEPGLVEAARRLGLDLVPLSRDALREQSALVQTRSVQAERLFGVASVAEAAALAGAGADAVLIVSRIINLGATCAVAEVRQMTIDAKARQMTIHAEVRQ